MQMLAHCCLKPKQYKLSKMRLISRLSTTQDDQEGQSQSLSPLSEALGSDDSRIWKV